MPKPIPVEEEITIPYSHWCPQCGFPIKEPKRKTVECDVCGYAWKIQNKPRKNSLEE